MSLLTRAAAGQALTWAQMDANLLGLANGSFFTPATGPWTPVLTFSTPGNLAVTYSVQVGDYTVLGNTLRLCFGVQTSAFTHTTASGNLQITGAPYAGVNTTGLTQFGSLMLSGMTKANYTQVAPYIMNGDTVIRFQAWGSGQSVSQVMVADTPTGAGMLLRGVIVYSI